jgi:hypothetical protein
MRAGESSLRVFPPAIVSVRQIAGRSNPVNGCLPAGLLRPFALRNDSGESE